eukprot:1548385-Amphidinium_carterae.1
MSVNGEEFGIRIVNEPDDVVMSPAWTVRVGHEPGAETFGLHMMNTMGVNAWIAIVSMTAETAKRMGADLCRDAGDVEFSTKAPASIVARAVKLNVSTRCLPDWLKYRDQQGK